MYDEEGEQVWERSLDLNGKVINGSNAPCPFLYQGQYYDKEIELAYNRFRYYDPDDGRYISKDPIGLLSGEYGFYNYVEDSNGWVDPFGLKTYSAGSMQKKKEKGQAPKEIDRFDNPHIPGQKPHVHFMDGTSLNNDGTIHDKHRGIPNPSNKTKKWLKQFGWES
ncbi:RHS repeat-associated core domain-containing protein [Tenacibaculum maritimum]|nr:hypothetical protein DPIF89300162_10102 [Tenacibaculum maritimum]